MTTIHVASWHHDEADDATLTLGHEPGAGIVTLASLGFAPNGIRFALGSDDVWALALPRLIAAAAQSHPGSTIKVNRPSTLEIESEEAVDICGRWRRWVDYVYANEPLAAITTSAAARERRQPLEGLARSGLAPADYPMPVRFSSGDEATPTARAIYRAIDPWSRRWPDPANDESPNSFRAWLEDTDGLARFARAVYWARADLRTAFDPATTRSQDFEHWLRANGLGPTPAAPRSVLKRLAAAPGHRLRRRWSPTLAVPRTPPRRASGVNVAGYLTAASGLGQAGRSTVDALSGVPTTTVDVSHRIHSPRLGTSGDTGWLHDISIFCLNAPELAGYAPDSLAFRLASSWSIGFYFWETETLPDDWDEGLAAVDEIWVASQFTKESIAQRTDRPIRVVGLAIDPPDDLLPDRDRWGLAPDTFTCTYITDALSGEARKNPLAAVAAFESAFEADAVLLLKVANLDAAPQLAAQLRGLGPSVRLIEEDLDRDALWSLLAVSDAYLSLHSSESLGLTILEAMSAGVPVVATGYGGNMDYMTEANSMIVPFRMEATTGVRYGGWGRWASPDLAAAAGHLRSLRADPDLRRRIGDAGRQTARAQYSPDAFRERLLSRLRELGLDA